MWPLYPYREESRSGQVQSSLVRRTKQRIISKTLASCHYHKGNTAKALGISRSTLWRKLREYGIRT
ncbi:MAG: helix-turn-helix domain-containing protein [Enterocloster sp.]